MLAKILLDAKAVTRARELATPEQCKIIDAGIKAAKLAPTSVVVKHLKGEVNAEAEIGKDSVAAMNAAAEVIEDLAGESAKSKQVILRRESSVI
jgi:hypothetical protein